jgi:multiple sugar transport system permease protein
MLKSRRNEILVAMVLIAPFVVVYGWLFIYPTIQMVRLSFTNAPLIGEGVGIGLDNYVRLISDRIFKTAVWNTGYFVLLTVIPGTAVALLIAMMVSRLKGWMQSIILAAFFLPFILPVTVVYLIWWWISDIQFGIAQYIIEPIVGQPVNFWRRPDWFMPMAALVTIWWTNGFSILLFLAGLRNISSEIYEAAALDGATRWQVFWRITWPLIWPVTALCLTIQLILQLKIFDQVYLFSLGGRTNTTMVLVQYIYEQAFVHNKGGYGATIAVGLFVLVVVVSVLQYQALRARGAR